MIVALLILITVVTVLYVTLPLLREPYWQYVNLNRLRDIYEEKKTGLWALTDIDNEYEMGKLSEDDYRALKEQFKTEVIPVLMEERRIVGEAIVGLDNKGSLNEKAKEAALSEVIRICGKRLS
ncbi:MAG TPA: hypothetical protein ENK09_09565 [Nitrospirae bacterium]|nr:hypothetical protein [Nitrospirota bacterium]